MGQQQSVNTVFYPTEQNSSETTADKMEATHQIIILQSKYVGPINISELTSYKYIGSSSWFCAIHTTQPLSRAIRRDLNPALSLELS